MNLRWIRPRQISPAGRPQERVAAEPIVWSAASRLATQAGHAVSVLLLAVPALVTAACPEYLSDHPERILFSTQDWGVLGLDTAAHAPDKPGAPIQIDNQTFAKGLGHHANGVITLVTEGQYESFDALVGVQPCAGGSVVFRVVVDGQLRFDSGLLRSGDPPQPVHVPIGGAREVRLEARDAGDGIHCDMANWAEARLTPAVGAVASGSAETGVDMARFARVVTWDPQRTEGARASRTEEFRAEDLFTETELKAKRDGSYGVPVWKNGEGCIGLQWLNRRALRELVLEFADAAQIPPTNTVRVEGWFGESAWQGHWKPLPGEWHCDGARLSFRLTAGAGAVQTQKIRWIFPAADKSARVRLSAFTRSGWATTRLRVESERFWSGRSFKVSVLNGELISDSPIAGSPSPTARRLEVRYSRPSAFKSDPTVLQFQLPTGRVAVAVEDVLANDGVYLPDFGLFVAREPLPVTLDEYKRRMVGRKTILEEVRALPDQTLAQAMARTHHEAQREGPVLLSLACDNTKFVVERHGAVRCVVTTNPAVARHETRLELLPQFGNGKMECLSRTLEGGWLPIPVLTVAQDGVVYRQRSFVAPRDEPGANPLRPDRRSVCVVEFTITNSQPVAADASLSLVFTDARMGKSPARLVPHPRGWVATNAHGVLARILAADGAPLTPAAGDGTLRFAGALPPGHVSRVTVFLPAGSDEPIETLDADRLRSAVADYWNAVLGSAAQIETPDALLNNVIRSSQVRCFIAARHEADGSRVAPWIAAMSYGPLESESHSVIRGMDFMGQERFARDALNFFIHRYNTNGFLSTGYTTFGTAWHLWTLGEHYQLARDRAWLRQIAPEIARVGHWIVRQLDKTRKRDAHGRPVPEFGLMPPGVLADWNSFAYHFAMNAYYVAALRELGDALGDIGHPDAAFFRRAAAELKANTLRAYAWTRARSPALPLRNGAWIPHYPSQVHSPGRLGDFFPGQDAGRSWCYDVELGAHQLVPAGVLDARSREVDRMMDHMEDVQFLADGWFDYPAASNHADWFNLGGFSKVQPYYCRNCEVYALRDDVKPFIRSYFNALASLLNPEVLTFWEHFRHHGAWDKTHETGYFLHQTRTMLVQERGSDLWLAPFVTTHWLSEGQRLSVSNAPTRFGPVSYELISRVAHGFIEARIEPPARNPPRQIVLRLRHPDARRLTSVTVDGRRHTAFDPERETITLSRLAGPIHIRAEF